VPDLFRVFPYLVSAANNAPGGALYVPPQGGGRIDNPSVYAVLYVSDAAPGALAEAFGRFPEWTPTILEGSPSLPGSVRAMARYYLPDDSPVCDLDDPQQLLALSLRPSDVVSHDYARTRSWARRIHCQGTWTGVRWWSYYDSEWASLALWNLDRLRLKDVVTLNLDDAGLAEAARTIVRRIMPKSR
jgi:hypothetical protein